MPIAPRPQHDLIPELHLYSPYSKFKYRFWFVWFVWHVTVPGRAHLLPWSAILGGADVSNRDLWFWEEEDEEYIEESFALPRTLDFLRPAGTAMPPECWVEACCAFARRQSLRGTANASSLAYLSSQTRLRVMAWLIVAGPVRKQQFSQSGVIPTIDTLIQCWAASLGLGGAEAICDICPVSSVLPIWRETMREIYGQEDLVSIPWPYRCQCIQSQLAATTTLDAPPVSIRRDSMPLLFLYELVVPPWPLICWLSFLTVADRHTNFLQSYTDSLEGPDCDLFVWDNQDDQELLRILAKRNDELTVYPLYWHTDMIKMPPRSWLNISNTTRVGNRVRRSSDGLMLRLVALFLCHTPKLSAFHDVLEPLNIDLDHFLFTSIASVVSKRPLPKSTSPDFEFVEFWTSSNLSNWLMKRNQNMCRAMWKFSPSLSVLERVRDMHVILKMLPQNLTMFAYSSRLQQSKNFRQSQEFLDIRDQFYQWESSFLVCIARYASDVKFLLNCVKRSYQDTANHTQISADVYKYMKNDVSSLVTSLVLFLRQPETYKEFLTCRDKQAQSILDLLQDLLDLDSFGVVKPLLLKALVRLSRASGLHPRCLKLPELQRIGQQVAAGGFGDIWKGSVSGQTVSVKIMRIFQDSHVEAVLKAYGREALIWRQLSHPNLLPFFGLYTMDNRLCLISPWMDNGNIRAFLAKEHPNMDHRLSLILDVALGLEYLHENNVVHGDLKGLNILVTSAKRACISDFGLSAVANKITLLFTHSTAANQGGTARYQAPELFKAENICRPHFGSDIYAFALVCYEILTGRIPFYELSNEVAVIMKVVCGERPSRPSTLAGHTLDKVWRLMMDCWQEDVEGRPEASQIVVHLLVDPLIGAKALPSTDERADLLTSRFRHAVQVQPLLPSISQLECMLFGDAGDSPEEEDPASRKKRHRQFSLLFDQ